MKATEPCLCIVGCIPEQGIHDRACKCTRDAECSRARNVRADGADVARSFRTVAHRVVDRIAADLEEDP